VDRHRFDADPDSTAILMPAQIRIRILHQVSQFWKIKILLKSSRIYFVIILQAGTRQYCVVLDHLAHYFTYHIRGFFHIK
jgi:hypothetical protein